MRRVSYNTPNPWVNVGKYFKAKEQCKKCENFNFPNDKILT